MSSRYPIIFIILLSVANLFAQPSANDLARAQAYYAESNTDSAVYYYIKTIQNYYREGRKVTGLNAAVDVADVFFAGNDFESGLKILETSTKLPLSYSNEEERTALLEAYLFLGYGYEQSGEFIRAKEIYESARLNLADKAEHEDEYVARYLYQPLGNIYTRLGDLEEALKLLERFREISINAKQYNAAAQAVNDIGIIYKSLNHYEKVISDYQNALLLPDLNPLTRGLLLSNLATAYYETLQYEKALQTTDAAVSHFQENLKKQGRNSETLSYLSLTYSTKGKIFTSLNKSEAAIENFRHSIELALQAYGTSKRREVAKIYISIGSLYLLQNEPKPALDHYQRALQCVIPDFKSDDILQNPEEEGLYPENTIFEALEGKIRAFEMVYESEKDAMLLKTALQCFDLISNVELQLRQDYLHESSKLFLLEESHRRNERALNVAHQLYSLTQNSRYIEEAFQIAERNKATLLLESLRALKESDFANIPDSILMEEREVRSGIALLKKSIVQEQLKGEHADLSKIQDLSNRLFTDESQLLQLKAELEKEHPQYFALRHRPMEDIPIEEIRNNILSPETQLIAYFLGESHLYVFSLTQNEMQIEKIDKEIAPEAIVQNLLQDVTNRTLQAPDPDLFAKNAYELYKILLQKVVREDKQKLIIVPDGILGYLPFDLLIDQIPDHPTFSRLPYLVKSKSISYGFSAGILLENSIKAQPAQYEGQLLALAPGFENSTLFSFLPFSEKEVHSIRQAFSGQVLLNEKASKSNFISLAGKYQILHLSTHAAVEDDHPLYSWISFSDHYNSPEEDHKLYLSELYSMHLNASLAVLSACETGRGKLSRGEGIMSLARGFAYAGCHSIVTTLWPVNDASTSHIMTRFYTHLADGLPKDEALRMAKMDYLGDKGVDQFGAHPFFWAAYIPVGNMDPIPPQPSYNFVWTIIVVMISLSGIAAYIIRKK